MRVIFSGYGRAALECLYQLMGNYDIEKSDVIIFTHNTSENAEFINHLKVNNFKFTFENINNSFDLIRDFSPDYLLSIYYRNIISTNILEVVNYQAMNLHPSLLPAYRGTKSSVWAILNNEKYTGVSFHYIDSGIDTGRIIFAKEIRIMEDDTAFSLYHKLIGLFSAHFCKAFDLVIANFNGVEQKGDPSYYPRKLPYDGKINIKELDLEDACRFVKAMYFPPHEGAIFILTDGSEVEINSIESLHRYFGVS
jgi:methionyl-tRNA formyltransferase